MRACFLGQNICTLGFGVAILQTPPIVTPDESGGSTPAQDENKAKANSTPPFPAAPTPPTAH